ncbi:MAG: DUF5688 family protein [Eubacteriales bacterium]|nr:DUF5688 family protein [Eubacteriales bacterium]
MSYEQFVETIRRTIQDLVDDNVKISIHRTVKNNGYEREGITFSEQGNHISPTIYLEEYYEKFNRGYDVKILAEQVIAMYRKVRTEKPRAAESLQDYESMKDRIIYKLVSREKNQELLKQVPYVAYLDLAVLFCVLIDMDTSGDCMTTMLVRNEHMDWWHVTVEDVYQSAVMNTEKLLPYEFSALYLMIQEMLGDWDLAEKEWKERQEQEGMYVLTNCIRNGGAAAMLYPGRLEMLGAYFKENYYILPSSIHELIVIPESRALPKEELECIVREVNETHVRAEEYLSNHVYYYDRERKKAVM